MDHFTNVVLPVVLITAGVFALWFFAWYLYDSYTRPHMNNSYTGKFWRRLFDAFCVGLVMFVFCILVGLFIGVIGTFAVTLFG